MKSAPASSTVTDGRPAPLEGCRCEICRFLNARLRLDADLAANYERYLNGELVSRDDSE